jgi:transposase
MQTKKTIRAPYEGKPHVRCDEGVLETGRWRGLLGHDVGNDRHRQTQSCTLPRQYSTLLSLITRYVSNQDMRASVLTSNHVHILKELSCRREQLVEILKIQKIQKQQITNLPIVKQMDKLIEVLQGQIKDLEAEMTETLKKEPDLAQKYRSLISILGIGSIVAISLICYLPELGSLSAKQIAKLAGLAPINWDSSKKQGKRFVQGGRMQVRNALYMSTIFLCI